MQCEFFEIHLALINGTENKISGKIANLITKYYNRISTKVSKYKKLKHMIRMRT